MLQVPAARVDVCSWRVRSFDGEQGAQRLRCHPLSRSFFVRRNRGIHVNPGDSGRNAKEARRRRSGWVNCGLFMVVGKRCSAPRCSEEEGGA